MNWIKYCTAYLVPITTWISFNSQGIFAYLPLLVFFGIVPFLELMIPTREEYNDSESTRKDPIIYDFLLYSMVPIQLFFLFYFVFNVSSWSETPALIGRIISMGIMCGIIGINVGHELGHRMRRWEKLLGEILLMTSLENHFTPYHNRGHHTYVATPKDPATARKNEPLYVFWFRSHFGSYLQAWQIEFQRMKISKRSKFSLSNSMIIYTILHITLCTSIFFIFGIKPLLLFLVAAGIGILLLETVNYIEHYGLLRKQRENGTYERVQRWHSWNSNHILGRVILFELSRHSDHHYKADKPYQLLETHDTSPTMPSGYPGMMLLSTIPPLFFAIMNKLVELENNK